MEADLCVQPEFQLHPSLRMCSLREYERILSTNYYGGGEGLVLMSKIQSQYSNNLVTSFIRTILFSSILDLKHLILIPWIGDLRHKAIVYIIKFFYIISLVICQGVIDIRKQKEYQETYNWIPCTVIQDPCLFFLESSYFTYKPCFDILVGSCELIYRSCQSTLSSCKLTLNMRQSYNRRRWVISPTYNIRSMVH